MGLLAPKLTDAEFARYVKIRDRVSCALRMFKQNGPILVCPKEQITEVISDPMDKLLVEGEIYDYGVRVALCQSWINIYVYVKLFKNDEFVHLPISYSAW